MKLSSFCFVLVSTFTTIIPCWGKIVVDVCNTRAERFDYVISYTITQPTTIALSADTPCQVREITEGITPYNVPCVLDTTSSNPQLVWLMPGVTRPLAIRTFELFTGDEARCLPPTLSILPTDLTCSIQDGKITVGNRFFELEHPCRGKGGMQCNVRYRCSGFVDHGVNLFDRAFDDKKHLVYTIEGDTNASARVLLAHPLRVVIEAQTGFYSGDTAAPDNLHATYRYIYSPNSPAVEVSQKVTRDAATAVPWAEVHFGHLSRTEKYYDKFVLGPVTYIKNMNKKGELSCSHSGVEWALMATDREACGVGGGYSTCWDASSEFMYYVTRFRDSMPREQLQRYLECVFYFGPNHANDNWLNGWLGVKRHPHILVQETTSTPNLIVKPKISIPLPVTNVLTLSTANARLIFGSAAEGFPCLSLEHLKTGTRFLRKGGGLWQLTWRQGSAGKSITLDASTSKGTRAVSRENGLQLIWENLSLENETNVVDVICDVTNNSATDDFMFRISVTNRSKVWGLYLTQFPRLNGVVPPGTGELLLPCGNWGCHLVKNEREVIRVEYPSYGWPMQFASYLQNGVGLYLGAEDSNCNYKIFYNDTENNATIHTLAANAGVPGCAGVPNHPFVLSLYEGDWWQAAKRYRAWALQQTWTRKGAIATRADYPQRLRDNGFWLQLGGDPKRVENLMQQTFKRVAGRVPFGVHWYSWHQIPFDNSYPEYNPALPGFAETTRRLTAQGMVIMPYINGRLWDRDIPSFQTAKPAATKDEKGTPRFETYGSGRWLAAMCPTTPLWQNKLNEICHWLIDDCGVNGIYIDQIGAAGPSACFDASHNHPLGGGSHWVSGYRTLLNPIKDYATKRKVLLTTENTAECYMDNIDAFLTWSPDRENDVPALPAVYSGYTTYFASPIDPATNADAFRACYTRDTLWGCQIGWISEWILDGAYTKHFETMVNLAQWRVAHRDYLVDGELIGEVTNQARNPPVTYTWWMRGKPNDVTMRSLYAVVWQARNGKRLLAVANLAQQPRTFRGTPPKGKEVTFELEPGAIRTLEYIP